MKMKVRVPGTCMVLKRVELCEIVGEKMRASRVGAGIASRRLSNTRELLATETNEISCFASNAKQPCFYFVV